MCIYNHWCIFRPRYDIIVDVAPEVKWIPEDGYKNLKIVVEIDNDISAQKASDQELRRRHKSLGILRIVTDRGLQVNQGHITISYLILLSVTMVDIKMSTLLNQSESKYPAKHCRNKVKIASIKNIVSFVIIHKLKLL